MLDENWYSISLCNDSTKKNLLLLLLLLLISDSNTLCVVVPCAADGTNLLDYTTSYIMAAQIQYFVRHSSILQRHISQYKELVYSIFDLSIFAYHDIWHFHSKMFAL
jgi:hypothetical protein